MNLRKLASLLAKKEGKKSQVAIGNIRELLSNLIELDVELLLSGASYTECAVCLLDDEVSKRVTKQLKKKSK